MTIEEQVKRLVAEQLGVKESGVSLDSHFVNDLMADSLDIVELQMACEEEFELDNIPDEIWDDVNTVQQMIDHVIGATDGR